jgi:phosphatidylglycerol:prolipoprotein diacylglycerol transferase
MPGIQIGPVIITYYGIILMSGALVGAWVATTEARRRGLDTEMVWDGLVWVIIGGILGARLWHILTPPPSMVERGITTAFYLTHPLDALDIRQGGLGLPGALIGGLLALYLFCRRRKTSPLVWVDVAAPGMAIGQAIGRWGNFVNQELYGLPTNLPWAIKIDPQHRLPEFQNFEYYHPTFLYESLWNLGNMFLLLWMARRYEDELRPGDLFLTYLVVYPVGRFFIEFLRLDSAQVAGINANQTVMAVVAVVAAGLLFYRHRFAPKPSKTQESRESVTEEIGEILATNDESLEDANAESADQAQELTAEQLSRPADTTPPSDQEKEQQETG